MGLKQDIVVVNEFSVPLPGGKGTRGGTPGAWSRVTSPSRSMERRVSVSTLGVMPPTAARNSPKRCGPRARTATTSGVHRSTTCRSTVREGQAGARMS